MTHPSSNPIGFLQEFCVKNHSAAVPKYDEVDAEGPPHARRFTCKCTYDGKEVVGKANQKKQAKFEAAKAMIELLLDEGYFEQFGQVGFDRNMLKDQRCPVTISQFKKDSEAVTTKNPISKLQEHCQSNGISLPNYVETSTAGGFVCECSVMGNKTFGHGTNKKTAKTEAAFKMCLQMKLCSVGESFNEELEEVDVCYSEKNPISALQELCNYRKSLPMPLYEQQSADPKGPPNCLFVVKCSVGSVSAQGTDTTKKGAKILAANKVLGMLQKDLSNGCSADNTGTSSSDTMSSLLDNLNAKISSLESSPRKNEDSVPKLEHFSLSSSDEDEDSIDKKPEMSKEDKMSHLQLTKGMESLALDDSLVEVEPSSAVVKSEPEEHDEECEHAHKIPTSETLLKWAKNQEVSS